MLKLRKERGSAVLYKEPSSRYKPLYAIIGDVFSAHSIIEDGCQIQERAHTSANEFALIAPIQLILMAGILRRGSSWLPIPLRVLGEQAS